MTDCNLMDSFQEAVNLVYEQDQLAFFNAAVEDVNDSFIVNFKKADEAQDEETKSDLVVAFTFFIVEQANTIPSMANYSTALGHTVETLSTTLEKTVRDRSLIPEDFMLCLLKGAKQMNNKIGGTKYEVAKHATVNQIIETAKKFRPATLTRPPEMGPPSPPKPRAETPAQPDNTSNPPTTPRINSFLKNL